ncbi:MAG: septum formation protein Maf [Candidatus Marinimicrobia bacterium]|nr:septum formation protein Maf [Candidatus Neomarinimicrobiota bacterium]
MNWSNKPVILASASPRRKQILSLAGITFAVHPSNYHEPGNKNATPEELVRNHAKLKALDVSGNYPDAWIIGADTIVVKDGKILEKPIDRNDAINMLKILSNATHQVYTGYCILNSQNGKFITEVEITDVTFHVLTLDMIKLYVDKYAPYDKAGSYGIQDFSAVFVKRICGCFYNVVGFPIAHFTQTCLHHLKSLQ